MSEFFADPIEHFHREFELAKASETVDVTAMALATASADGAPSVRYVLLKEATAEGFVFFTNGESRKGAELRDNPRASLAFLWPNRYVQVRVEGRVEPLSAADSDAYFASRPRGSQIGAWASDQSRPVASREVLEARVAELEARYAGAPVPRPPHWGGYRVVPSRVEFWYGRESRLHDRLAYLREASGWRTERLCP